MQRLILAFLASMLTFAPLRAPQDEAHARALQTAVENEVVSRGYARFRLAAGRDLKIRINCGFPYKHVCLSFRRLQRA
jgi:hypothetical protein